MTLFAYKLNHLPLIGWSDFGQMFIGMIEFAEDDPDAAGWRDRVEARAEAATVLFLDMEWHPPKSGRVDMLFAPLPVIGGYADSDYLVAVQTDKATYIASPVELPWLADGAVDTRRSEMLEDPPSASRN